MADAEKIQSEIRRRWPRRHAEDVDDWLVTASRINRRMMLRSLIYELREARRKKHEH